MVKRHIRIAIPSMGWMTTGLAASLADLAEAATQEGSRYRFTRSFANGVKPVDYARNLLVKSFLRSDAEALLFLDSDIIPPQNLLDLLHVDADIVAALMPMWQATDAAMPGYAAFTFDETQRLMVTQRAMTDTAIAADGASTAAMLIRRHVLEDRRMHYETSYSDFEGSARMLNAEDAPPVFREPRKPNGELSATEDIDFCYRARKLGYTLKIHHGVKLRHMKEVDLQRVIEYGFLVHMNSLDLSAPSGAEAPAAVYREAQSAAVHAAGGN